MATRSLNRAQIIGNLGAEPELKMLNSGMAVCNLAIATSESWTDKNTGELKEATEWHRITLWDEVPPDGRAPGKFAPGGGRCR